LTLGLPPSTISTPRGGCVFDATIAGCASHGRFCLPDGGTSICLAAVCRMHLPQDLPPP
jgi:hypothetical protein